LPPVHLGRNDEMRKLIAGAIELHLSGMRKDGEPVPEPSFFEMVEVAG
jgi:predicted RNase H-like HicB family nuclease